VSAQNFRVIFYEGQGVGNPPAKSTRKVTAQNVTSATLNWSFKPQTGVSFNDIRFNGSIISVKPDGGANVTHLLLANGNNTVELNYSRWVNWFGDAGNATVTLDVIASKVGQTEPSTLFNFGQYKNWAVAIVVLLVLVLVVWFLMKTSMGGKVASAVYGTGKEIAKAVGGS